MFWWSTTNSTESTIAHVEYVVALIACLSDLALREKVILGLASFKRAGDSVYYNIFILILHTYRTTLNIALTVVKKGGNGNR